MRLVTWKNGASPSITTQRASTPPPRAYAISERSISAKPPPLAVELTFQTTRPCSRRCPSSTARSKAAACSALNTAAKRSGASGGIGTSSGNCLLGHRVGRRGLRVCTNRNDEDRAVGHVQQSLRDAAEQQPTERRVAARCRHDQVGVFLIRD